MTSHLLRQPAVRRLCLAAMATILIAQPATAGTAVAVFNFHMKSDTPEWLWLEKGLADRVTTDLFQDRSITLMQRDKMQQLARQMNWVPEMMQDRDQLKKISFRARYIISGAYEVEGDTLTITAQIVDFKTAKEVARRSVSGKTKEALQLVRKLSAELLAWLTKKSPDKILANLPAWTRSIPAAKALYEGVDLYDQGRYGEGWLNFRRASREDPGYIEAKYWVGKMYYFMNRYRHARRAFEEFVYLDDNHPRMGDAIVEHVHTFEKTGASADTLLSLYRDLWTRFQKEDMDDEILVRADPSLTDHITDWLRRRAAIVLQTEGRHREAVDVVTRHDIVLGDRAAYYSDEIVTLSMRLHIARTGGTFTAAELWRNWPWLRRRGSVVSFSEGQREAVSDSDPCNVGPPIYGYEVKNVTMAFHDCLVSPPPGHVITSLRFFPLTKAREGTFTVGGARARDDYYEVKTAPLETALKEGVVLDHLPRTGLVQVMYRVISKKKFDTKEDVLKAARVVGTFEKLDAFGAIDVLCMNTTQFDVDVDGQWTRRGPGVVGLLSPGKHTIRLYPIAGQWTLCHWGELTVDVDVAADRTTALRATLPGLSGGDTEDWPISTLIGNDYPGYYDFDHMKDSYGVATLVDDEAIRLVWPYGLDLWSSVSTDGRTFSRPRKLDLPVSSAWAEKNVDLLRDEQGRFLLRFRSNRGMRHRMKPFLCWSRDFQHWSAPAEIPVSGRMFQDSRGQFVLSGGHPTLDIWSSRDAFAWQQVAKIRPPNPGWVLKGHVTELEDGTYEILAEESKPRQRGDKNEYPKHVYYMRSRSLKKWADPEFIADIGYGRWRSGAVRVTTEEGIRKVAIRNYYYDSNGALVIHPGNYSPKRKDKKASYVDTYARGDDGRWTRLSHKRRKPTGKTSISGQKHPRWGECRIWMVPRGEEWYPHPSYGPFFMRKPGAAARPDAAK